LSERIEIKRLEIADVFEKHFKHFGFRKTTVDEVAAEMGISKKTIYKCFNSKDDIFYFIISQKAKARRAMIEKEIMHLKSAWHKMESMIRINFSEFRKIHKRHGSSINERFRSDIASAAFRETFIGLVDDIIREGLEREEFEVCNHQYTIRFIQSMIIEAVSIIREDPRAEPEEMLICSVQKLILKTT
jgi:AcrR family transcriptional regulator